MAKVPRLSGDEYPQHTTEQEAWITKMAGESWTVAAVLTADSSDPGQPVQVVLRTRSEERRYRVDADGSETLVALLPRG